ncbi:MAG TPA: restriction endonuclease subunit S [Spirochaetota bacterium]|nr:restriction endonuclease subunit S [Spirochaetota bacterium]
MNNINNKNMKVPEGWKRVRLGEVCNITTGKKDVDEGNPEGQYLFFTCARTPTRSDSYSFDTEALLIAGNGEVGNIQYYKGKFEVYQRTYVLYDFKNIKLKYVYYYLKNNLIRSLENEKIGTTIQYIKYKNLNDFNIPSPPLPEQQKIAEILETVDNAIEKTEKIIEKYKRIKQGLMQDLLTRGIDENGKIRSEKTHKFKNSPLGKIPEEWEVVRLGEVCYLKGRIGWHGLTTKEYLEEGKYYLVLGINFENGKIIWENCYYIDEKRYNMDKNIQLKNEDILITKDGTIGKVSYIEKLPKKATLGTGVFVLRPINESYYPKFFYYILTSFIFDKFIENLKTGSTINHLYQKDFILFSFTLPPLPEQQRIAEILSQIDNTIKKEEAYKQKLERIKKGLMEDLLTGRVRVNKLIEN